MLTKTQPKCISQKKALDKWVAQIKAPEGFTTKGLEQGNYWNFDAREYLPSTKNWSIEFISENIKIKFDFNLMTPAERKNYWPRDRAKSFGISGHTDFKGPNGAWFSFDRTGVDDSFYGCDADDPGEIIQKQISRCKEAFEKNKNQVQVPVIGFYITPERKAEIITLLTSGRFAQFMPSGFGTGYRLYRGPKRSQWDKVAPQEVCDFFGVQNICWSEMDCD